MKNKWLQTVNPDQSINLTLIREDSSVVFSHTLRDRREVDTFKRGFLEAAMLLSGNAQALIQLRSN